MSALTCTINGTVFGALTSASGRKCIECKPLYPKYEVKRFKVPGVNGRYKIREGANGGVLVASLRYIDQLTTAHSNFVADRAAWNNQSITVIDQTGVSWTRCELEHMEIVKNSRGILGSPPRAFFDAIAIFQWDGYE